jgi:hypothetical protein
MKKLLDKPWSHFVSFAVARTIWMVVIFHLVGCHHYQKEFDSQIHNTDCENALMVVPELQPAQYAVETALWATKNTLAYSYVGANYTAEVVWDVSVGTVGFVALCWPVFLIYPYAANRSNSMVFGSTNQGPVSCLPSPVSYNSVRSPPLGRNALEKTQEFRCPNVDGFAKSLEKVAQCFEKRNQPGDIQKAVRTLENIEKSKDFFKCLKVETQERITFYKQELQTHL